MAVDLDADIEGQQAGQQDGAAGQGVRRDPLAHEQVCPDQHQDAAGHQRFVRVTPGAGGGDQAGGHHQQVEQLQRFEPAVDRARGIECQQDDLEQGDDAGGFHGAGLPE